MDAGHLLTKMPRIVSFDKETVNVKLSLPRNYKSTLVRVRILLKHLFEGIMNSLSFNKTQMYHPLPNRSNDIP